MWALKIEQKGAGEEPAGRKGDVTKLEYLSDRIIKLLIHDDTGPTNSDSENNPKIRAAQRAAWKTPGDTILMGLGSICFGVLVAMEDTLWCHDQTIKPSHIEDTK